MAVSWPDQRVSAPDIEERTDVVATVARSHAAAADLAGELPGPVMDALRRSGLFGLLVPCEYGGLGGDVGDLTWVAGELGAACTSAGFMWAMHCQQVEVITRYGSPSLRERVLPAVGRGELYVASVTTEADRRSSPQSVEAALSTTGDGRVEVKRVAPVVTGGTLADAFLVAMRASAATGERAASLVYVERCRSRVVPTSAWNAMGMRGTGSGGLELEAIAGDDAVLGAGGDYARIATECMIPLAHVGWTAVWLGAARQAYREVVSHARRRGDADGGVSDLFAARLAEPRVNLELVATYLESVADGVAEARRSGRSLSTPAAQIQVNVLKVAGARLLFEAVDLLIDIAGLERGYMQGDGRTLERVFRDLRSGRLNISDDRLLVANGGLALADRNVSLGALRTHLGKPVAVVVP
jgi:acyl-CoA dehydrogenase